MPDPIQIQNVADVLAENRDYLAGALILHGDPDDPGYDEDLVHIQALDQAHDLLVDYADLSEAQQ